MFQAFVDGFLLVFEWRVFAFMLLGVAIGIWLGAIPGLGGITGLVLLIPFTFGMDPAPAFAMLLGMQAVIHTSDTIPAVVMGVPGTAAAQATVLDGFPLAQRGEGGRALGAAFTASAIGGVVGALSLAICLPLIKPIILSVGNPEKFALGVLGLALVGSLSGASILKGLAIAAFGLLLSTIGYAPSAPIPRFWFGIDYLIVELPFIPVVLGIFALAEVIDLALRNTSISRTAKSAVIGGDMLTGIKDALSHWWLILRCSAIGAYIGLLPGLGAAISDWVAYGHAVQGAKDRSQFGKGDIRGVIGPEAANNATLGGDLVPTVAFALPGSASMAIMLTVMLVHGLVPGQAMLTTNAHLTFSMVWTVAIANVIGAGLLMIWARQVAKVAFIPGQLVVPGVIVFLFMGAWFANASLGDWLTCLVFGILGFFMKRGGWPRPPLVLALVLGNIMENAFVISTRAYEGWLWLTRPMFLVIMALVVLTLFVSARGYLKNRGAQADEAGEGNARNPLISLPIAVLLFVAFGAAVFAAQGWVRTAKIFPLTAAIPGVALAGSLIFWEGRALLAQTAQLGGIAAVARVTAERTQLRRGLQFLAYLLGLVLLMMILGHKIAIPLFVALYVIRWGGYNWRVAVLYAAAAWAFLIVFYDRILHVFWYRSALFHVLTGSLPDWFPHWLVI